MSTYLATPHLYGCELKVYNPTKFKKDYGNQGNKDDKFVLMEPRPTNLVVWANSCLGIGEFRAMHRRGGWSPFRSGEVMITSPNGETNIYNYKLGDDNEWDVTATIDPRTVSIEPWKKTVGLFAELALNLYVRALEANMSIPKLAVKQMLYAEYGECDNIFAYLLHQKGFDVKMLDEAIEKYWQKILKLPLPDVFAHINDDDVKLKIVDMTQNRLK